jgi:hypothetical protein
MPIIMKNYSCNTRNRRNSKDKRFSLNSQTPTLVETKHTSHTHFLRAELDSRTMGQLLSPPPTDQFAKPTRLE